jgi:muramoyltetrapeptide carboxypeptidase LdcA involved in peptidoglycan recycling
MKRYQVKVYNEADNSYRLAMETSDIDAANNKMERLKNQGHQVQINLKSNPTPSNLKNVSSKRLNNLIELFKPKF